MNSWTTHSAEYQANLEYLSQFAKQNGLVLNPESARVEKVVGLMTENLVAFGKRFCPCKQSHPLDPEKDIVCPCSTWQQEVKEQGHCYCRLFYRSCDRE